MRIVSGPQMSVGLDSTAATAVAQAIAAVRALAVVIRAVMPAVGVAARQAAGVA